MWGFRATAPTAYPGVVLTWTGSVHAEQPTDSWVDSGWTGSVHTAIVEQEPAPLTSHGSLASEMSDLAMSRRTDQPYSSGPRAVTLRPPYFMR